MVTVQFLQLQFGPSFVLRRKIVKDFNLTLPRFHLEFFFGGGNWGSLLNSQFVTHLWHWLYYEVVIGPQVEWDHVSGNMHALLKNFEI